MSRWAVYDTSGGASAPLKRVVDVRGAPDRLDDMLAENLAAGEEAIDAPDDAYGEVFDDTHEIADPGGTPTLIRTHTVEYSGGSRVLTEVP